jgi:prepilin-type N-terminal cleavage/methylation domain-containing protein
MQIFSKKNKGFTLIELLVVIAIIGILSTIVLVSMGSARGKARDAKRQSDIRQMGTAMELAYTDNGNQYVTTSAPVIANGALGQLTGLTGYFTTYLPTMPLDPGGGTVAGKNAAANTGYTWIGNPASSSYFCVYATLESGKFFAASRTGVKEFASAPTTMETCQ